MAIDVTTRNAGQGSRYFVAADDGVLIVLNLTEPTFVTMQKTGALSQNDVRIGRDGLFVADRRIADFERVVEAIARNDVKEIWGPVVARGSTIGAVFGGWVGFAVGVVPGLGGASQGVAWLWLIGSVATGGYLGSHWSSHETEGLVYQAP